MRRSFASLFVFSLLASAGPASAAPVFVAPVLGITVQGLAPLTVGGSGIIDVTGSTITIPAGLVALGSAIIVPVTATTVINTLSITKLSNLSGTFSIGGVTAQLPSEVCPAGGPVANDSGGAACNVGGSIGGVMALTGTLFVNIIPNIVVIPVNLNSALIGQGGSTNQPFMIDAAAWTTGVGLVNTGVNTVAQTASHFPYVGLQLVSPTFVSALGNLLPIFVSLTISNPALPVPEPAAWLLVGAAGIGLVALRRRR